VTRGGPQRVLPVLEHLEELRNRLIKSVLAWFVGAIVAYLAVPTVLQALQHLLVAARATGQSVNLAYLDVTEPLVTVFRISAFGGLILAMPVIVYQAWGFVAPGLTATERRWAVPFILSGGLAFAAGAAFGYLVVLPVAIPFLIGFLGTEVQAVLSLGRYIAQVITYLLAFGLIFELPVLAYLLTKIGVVNAAFLARNRRYAILINVIVAAIITPTVDPFNLFLMAGPMIVLYEIGIVVSRLAAPRPAFREQPDAL